MSVAAAVEARALTPADLDRVIEIDARCTDEPKPDSWRRVFGAFLEGGEERFRVALGAAVDGRLIGYLLGEVRAFEFGSEPCGWIFAVGVDPARGREGVGSALLAEACRLLRASGVRRIRTMVQQSDVPVLSFFRAHGFVAGPFLQLQTVSDSELAS